jgi:N-methylhydantoinase A/oxoprolinase/acetone carboxylase beta subunit
MSKPSLKPRELRSDGVPETARRRSRCVYWSEFSEHRETAVYDGHGLDPGNVLSGPAIVELDTTTVVVRPDQRLNVDAYGNLEIHVATGTGAVSA